MAKLKYNLEVNAKLTPLSLHSLIFEVKESLAIRLILKTCLIIIQVTLNYKYNFTIRIPELFSNWIIFLRFFINIHTINPQYY